MRRCATPGGHHPDQPDPSVDGGGVHCDSPLPRASGGPAPAVMSLCLSEGYFHPYSAPAASGARDPSPDGRGAPVLDQRRANPRGICPTAPASPGEPHGGQKHPYPLHLALECKEGHYNRHGWNDKPYRML
ncbi:hypothetical protein BDV29DRAFT_172448 [Aspergillus leporis]|uniref:Uncharacterized protein n=1 Tax=Aspergillus leporis TaxID=41062 RepID=A0A5N5X2P5_9EURO|nr:hypothetical protein BDV29DRAFT_172448 [Aspergillus leporis]